MKKFLWITGLIGFVIFQTPAQADTACEGIRAGLQVGFGVIDSKLTTTRTLLIPVPNVDYSDISGRGGILGFCVDWMSLVGNSDIMAGAEASINFLTTKGKKSTIGTFPSAVGVYTGDLSTSVFFKRSLEVVAKFGYMFKGAAVAYVRVGPSFGTLKASSVSNTLKYKGDKAIRPFGLVMGVGAEFPVTDRLAFGTEYNYRRYPTFSHNLMDSSGISQLNMSIIPNSHAVMFRFSYKLSAVDFATPQPKERKRKRSRPQKSGA